MSEHVKGLGFRHRGNTVANLLKNEHVKCEKILISIPLMTGTPHSFRQHLVYSG